MGSEMCIRDRFYAYFLVDIVRTTVFPLPHNAFPISAEQITDLAIELEHETHWMPETARYSGSTARSVLHDLRDRVRTGNGEAFAREAGERGTNILRGKP